jgi:serine protease
MSISIRRSVIMIINLRFISFTIIFMCFLFLLLTAYTYSYDFRIGEHVSHDPDKPRYAPNEILVAFKRGTWDDVIRDIHNRLGAASVYPSFSGDFQIVKFGGGKTVEEMVELYYQEPQVDFAEPNYIARALFVPNDPFYKHQWNFQSPDNGGINLEKAWDISTGRDVIVAVIDTGVAYEDYKGFLQAPDLEGVSFVPGYDFVDGDSHPNDENGHGTHVTGTIAQRTNNNLGVAGAAFDCSIMPIRVLDEDGYGTYAAIINGIDFAVERGANVINMSLGSGDPSIALERSLAKAHESGVTIVAAAGNEFFWGSPTSYPAAYDAYSITVGAVRYDGKRAPYSNVGDYIDISAPGGDLSADQNEDNFPDGIVQQAFIGNPADFQYWFFEGTSMAAPHVSAAAAILMANGINEPNDITEALIFSARDMGAKGWDEEYGFGIVDVYDALNYVSKEIRDIGITNIKAQDEVISGDIAKVEVTARNHGTQPENVQITLMDDQGEQIGIFRQIQLELASSHKFTFLWNTRRVPLGKHLLTAELNRLPNEDNLTDNSGTVEIDIVAEIARTMYVEDVKIEENEGFIAKSYTAVVTIVNGVGKPVEDAWVFGDWKGILGWQTFAVTGIDGLATFFSGPIFNEEDVDFTVGNVVKRGWIYKPGELPPGTSVNTQDKQGYAWGKLKGMSKNMTPDSTIFYQNYPNPFNPDTWIPYQLAEGAEVLINIYSVSGKLIRTLDLGFKNAGFYLDKDSAAYWDGNNSSGEKVSSGIYFYNVKAGDFMATRKIIITR